MILRKLMEGSTVLTYKKNQAQGNHILEHIANCNFEPPLHTYLDVNAYVEKILNNAERFECWDGDKLVGFLGVYCNDHTNKVSYITLVSVDSAYGRQGIAKTLMDEAESFCKANKFKSIALEVYDNNMPAINLYEKRGFVVEIVSGHSLIMTKGLISNHG